MVIQSCTAHGLKEPLFCPGIDQFKVVLFRPNWDVDAGNAPRNEQETSEKRVRLGEEAVHDLLAEYGEMSVKELQERTGLNKTQVRNRLRKLIAAGKVIPTAPASSKKRTYRPA